MPYRLRLGTEEGVFWGEGLCEKFCYPAVKDLRKSFEDQELPTRDIMFVTDCYSHGDC
jgi:hypothetical protein